MTEEEIEDFEYFPSRLEMMNQNYFYESPYYIIENPRSLDSYFSLIELELERKKYKILLSKKSIASRSGVKSVPFEGVIRASTIYKAKEIHREDPNFVLMLFSIIAILYAIITVFFTPALPMVLPLLLVYLIIASVSVFLYVKALKQKGKFGLNIYNSQTFLMTEIVATGLGILISLIGTILLIINYTTTIALTIPLTILIVLSLGAIIGRCFFEFRVKKTYYPTLGILPAYFYIHLSGIIHQKLLKQSLSESNIAKKATKKDSVTKELSSKSVLDQDETVYLTYIKEVDKLELKFVFSYDFTEELPEEAQQIIDEFKTTIIDILNSQPVKLPKKTIKDQVFEAPLISNLEPREFPIDFQE